MKTTLILTLFLATLLLATAASAAPPDADTFLDPNTAGPDYAVQGEYLGKGGEENEVWGAQIVALGDGKFDAVGYSGGLPGQGWSRGQETHKATGETKDGVTSFKGDDWTATIKDGVLKVFQEDKVIAELKKIERKSPTLGAKPPEGAIVLFDGSSVDAFDNGKFTEGKLLAADCSSKQKFGDHSLHIEFCTPFKPKARGQARGNSGVYAQSRYEIQVLDSFGLDGKNNECGGIYSIAEPAVNMCFPPLAWQTYDIDFKAAKYDDSGKKIANARITIKHNGVVIHNDLELPKGTPGKADEGPGPAPLYLQGHGNPVAYQNIWVVAK